MRIGVGITPAGIAVRRVPSGVVSALPKFSAALAARAAGTSPAIIAFVGDSVTQGWGGSLTSGAGTGDPSQQGKQVDSWPSQLAALIEAAGTPTRTDSFWGSKGYDNLAPYNIYYAPILEASAPAANNFSAFQTIGGNFLDTAVQGNGYNVFYPKESADRFDIYYPRRGSGALLSVSGPNTPGANEQQYDTNGASGFIKITYQSGQVHAPNAAIIFNTVGGGNSALITGIVARLSTAPQVEFWNLALTGTTTADWTNSTNPWNYLAVLGSLQAHLYFIELGANDANFGVSAATYKANLLQTVDTALATGTGDVVLVKCHTATTAHNLPADYLAAIDDIRAMRSLPPVLNFNAISLASTDRFDGIHLAKPGYAKEAAAALTYLRAQAVSV